MAYCCLPQGSQEDLYPIPDAAIACVGPRISWVGKESELPSQFRDCPTIDAAGGLAIPGLIDCHTHLAFAGFRAEEFRQRIAGKSYLEIAGEGGGILSTVEKTRIATKEQLVERCLEFLRRAQELGITTVECKSGYGLDLDSEIKLLEVYRHLNTCQPITLVPTLLAAHTIPREFKNNRAAYVRLICDKIIPQVAERKLAFFCDIFVEKSAFNIIEAEEILTRAATFGLRGKLHADQLSSCGGADLAARCRAISADHLEHCSTAGMQALKQAGVIGVMLPLASLFTFEPPCDARPLMASGARVALASDFNPGSAPTNHLPLAMMLGCTLNRMTPAQVLKATTCYAAAAVGLDSTTGSLSPGMAADIAVIDAESIDHWLYHFREQACRLTIKSGSVVYSRRSVT